VLLSSLVSATNDFLKGKKFFELSSIEKSKEIIQVTRGGNNLYINMEDVVVGDLVQLNAGMEVVGDGIIIEGSYVKIDESHITGENRLMNK
jgi:P-type E1-E2 ATPase